MGSRRGGCEDPCGHQGLERGHVTEGKQGNHGCRCTALMVPSIIPLCAPCHTAVCDERHVLSMYFTQRIALIFKVDVCFQMSLSQRTKTLGTLGILGISRQHPSIEWTRNTSECAKHTAVVLVPDLNPSTTSTAPNKDHMCL